MLLEYREPACNNWKRVGGLSYSDSVGARRETLRSHFDFCTLKSAK